MKTINILSISAIFSLALVSCAKEENFVEEIFAPYGTMTASIVEESAITKTSLVDGIHVSWNKGDVIRITPDFASYVDGTAQSSGSSATFSLSSTLPSSSSYYAYYPRKSTPVGGGDEVNAIISAGTAPYTVKFSSMIFPVQQAVLGSFDASRIPMGAYAAADKELFFVNLASLVRFSLVGDGVAKVVIEDQAGKAILAGGFFTSCYDSNDDKILDSFQIDEDPSQVNYSTSVTIVPPVGQTTFPSGEYYAAIRPNVTCANGIMIKVYDSAGNLMKGQASVNSVTFNRGKIRSVGTVNCIREMKAFAGKIGTAGSADGAFGTGTLNLPEGIFVVSDGLYVLQRGGRHALRKISFDGTISTLAHAEAYSDISYPWQGSADAEEDMFFCNKGSGGTKSYLMFYDKSEKVLSKITIADVTLRDPMDCVVDSYGYVYLANRYTNKVLKLQVDKAAKTAVKLAEYDVASPSCLAIDKRNNVIVGSAASGYLRMISAEGNVSNIAGDGVVSGSKYDGADGNLVGNCTIGNVNGIHVGNDGCIYFAQVHSTQALSSVRKLIPAQGGDYAHGTIHTVSYGCYASDVATSPDCSKIYLSSSTTHSVRIIENVSTQANQTMLEKLQNCPALSDASSVSSRQLTNGVEQHSFGVTLVSGKNTQIHVIKFNTKTSGLNLKLVLPKDPSTGTFYKSPMRDMASREQTKTEEVIAMVPADYYGATDGTSTRGPIVFNHQLVKNDWYVANGLSYMGVTDDNTVHIGTRAEYDLMSSNEKTAYKYLCGGHQVIVNKGNVVPYRSAPSAFNAVGYDLDGNVYMMIADYNTKKSLSGIDWDDAGNIMRSLGCYMAFTEQTGSHAMMMVKDPTTKAYQIVSNPVGSETAVVSAWAITKNTSITYPSTVQSAVESCPAVRSVSNWTETAKSDGVKLYKGHLSLGRGHYDSNNNWIPYVCDIYLVEASLASSNVDLVTGLYNPAQNNYPAEGEGAAPSVYYLNTIAQRVKSSYSKQVQYIVTGDMYDNTGPDDEDEKHKYNEFTYRRTRGPIHSKGNIVKSYWTADYTYFAQQALGYMGIKSDNSMQFGLRSEYDAMDGTQKSAFTDLQGTGCIMLLNGNVYPDYTANCWNGVDPRAAYGYNSETKKLYILVADGRNEGVSEGLAYCEMTDIFKWLGCSAAANLDGGGSAQIYEWQSGTTYNLVNHPVGYYDEEGKPVFEERKVPVGWAVLE